MLDMITNPLLKELLKTITFKFNNCIQQKTPFIYKNHFSIFLNNQYKYITDKYNV